MLGFDNPSEKDKCEVVLEGLPRSPITDPDICWDNWIGEACMALKGKMWEHDLMPDSVYKDAQLVKKAIVLELMDGGLLRNERKRLCMLWNKCLGSYKNTSDWPENVVWAVDAYGTMPELNKDLFCSGQEASPWASKILASIYVVGVYDSSFLFAMTRYAELIGCSHQTIKRMLDKLSDRAYKDGKGRLRTGLGVLQTIPSRRVSSGNHFMASNWYALRDKELLLDILGFSDKGGRKRFVEHVQSLAGHKLEKDWSDYLISYEWLNENGLTRMI